MKVNELRDLSTAELEEKLAESKQELFNLRFQNAINQLENPKRIGDVKKTIARISTSLHLLSFDRGLVSITFTLSPIEHTFSSCLLYTSMHLFHCINYPP